MLALEGPNSRSMTCHVTDLEIGALKSHQPFFARYPTKYQERRRHERSNRGWIFAEEDLSLGGLIGDVVHGG
jgi:hypothetical protein